MARLTGPLHSDGASGTLNGSVTYSKWKGNRAYARACVTPKNPKTVKQTACRAMWKFLAQAWKSIGTVPQASWKTLADATSITNFNAYMKTAMSAWHNFLAPQQTYNAAKASAPLTITTHTTTGGVGCITNSITPSGVTAAWGIAIFRGLTGFTPSNVNCIAVIPWASAGALTFVDTPLAPGTYYYRACTIQTDGQMGTMHAEVSGTAT